ncbi:MAG: LemA family protein [Actinobacteria bacterium]|nr:LemA family protein [Actinomycetota bacterium]
MVLLIVLGVVVVLGLWIAITFNGLVRLRNRIDNAWSQIDVQLKRRYDLIPNLVETVKGYAAHEKETLERVIQARAQGVQAQGVQEQAQAENMITGALRQLFALSEQYPNLKANENFLALQEELTATEDRIRFARQFYNDSVLQYDNRRQAFPANVIAGMFNFVDREYFEVEGEGREPVQVEF